MAETGRYTVLTMMKNEGPYILEWVAHHKALGFDDIVICTNDCEDTTVGIVERLEELGLARHMVTKIRKGGIQRSALRQAARIDEVANAEWVYVCDVDEFLNIHVGDGTVQALVKDCGPFADVIAVPWRVFGPGEQTLFRDRTVTSQFIRAEAPPAVNPGAGKFVKSLLRKPRNFARLGTHMPVGRRDLGRDIITVMPGGARYVIDDIRTSAPVSFARAQVNHYALRSLEAYLIKRARGRVNHTGQIVGMEYWHRFDLNDVEDLSISRYDTAVTAWLDRLKDDEALHFLHRKSVRWHSWKARSMRNVPDAFELKREIKTVMRARMNAAAGAEDERLMAAE